MNLQFTPSTPPISALLYKLDKDFLDKQYIVSLFIFIRILMKLVIYCPPSPSPTIITLT